MSLKLPLSAPSPALSPAPALSPSVSSSPRPESPADASCATEASPVVAAATPVAPAAPLWEVAAREPLLPVAKSAAAGSQAVAAPGVFMIGTSGYSYPEWVDAGIYPPTTKPAQMLSLYLAQFPAVELNYTWYQLPKAEAIDRQCRQTPPAFRFAAKLTRTMTHEIDAAWPKQVAAYRDGIAPLIETRQLAAVLIQLAPDFTYTVASRRYLAALLKALQGLPLAVEFRHASWAKPRVYSELARRQVALVAVDTPALPQLFPTVLEATCASWFYIRFHGRNAKGWQSGQAEQKFHYDYREAELAAWLDERIALLQQRVPTGYAFFNNHHRGHAARNAQRLQQLAAQRGMTVARPP